MRQKLSHDLEDGWKVEWESVVLNGRERDEKVWRDPAAPGKRLVGDAQALTHVKMRLAAATVQRRAAAEAAAKMAADAKAAEEASAASVAALAAKVAVTNDPNAMVSLGAQMEAARADLQEKREWAACRRRSGDGAGESRDFQPAVAQARVRRRRDSRGQTQTRERERWDVRRPGAALDDGGHPGRGARFPRGFRPAPGGRRFEPCGARARDARRVLRQASASVHVHARGPRGGGAPAARGARIRGDGRASRPGVARAALRAQQRQGGNLADREYKRFFSPGGKRFESAGAIVAHVLDFKRRSVAVEGEAAKSPEQVEQERIEDEAFSKEEAAARRELIKQVFEETGVMLGANWRVAMERSWSATKRKLVGRMRFFAPDAKKFSSKADVVEHVERQVRSGKLKRHSAPTRPRAAAAPISARLARGQATSTSATARRKPPRSSPSAPRKSPG